MSTAIEEYNPDWPSYFEQIRASLDVHLHHIPGLAYSHIGSTSIRSLSGRPIIDILLTVPPENTDRVTATFASNRTYERLGPEQPARGTVFSARGASQHAHSVYICAPGSLAARVHLGIRDTLRGDEGLRAVYTGVKTDALRAAKDAHSEDKDCGSAYTRAKNEVLRELVIASAQFSSADLAAVFASECSARWTPLCTSRTMIREFELRDVEGMFALEGNEENARYQDWHPWTWVQARQNVLRGIRRSYEKDRDVVELAVVYEGAFVGRIGGRVTAVAAAADEVKGESRCEVGKSEKPVKHVDLWYSFLPSNQGKGLATEAMTAFIAQLVEKEKVDGRLLELEIECDPRNTGSWKLAERLGFGKHRLTERAWESKCEWVDSLVYRKIS
jgi:RimJ/RimL family protein N-acetyltransferase/GrpB-like predicted nucleotidyltransferase (UPF0157 family)